MEQPEQFGRERRQPSGRRRLENGRDEILVQHDLPIRAAFNDLSEGDARVRLRHFTRQQQTGSQRTDFEQRRVSAARCVIAGLEFVDVVPHESVPVGIAVRRELTGPTQRHGEIEDLIADVRADVNRLGQRIVVRQPEGRAVWKHSRRVPQASLADAQEVGFELELGEAPAVRHERLTAALDVALEIALLLLEMLGLQEQPLGPDDAAMRRHSHQTRRPRASRPVRRPRGQPRRLSRPSANVHVALNL
jgi:hypothetical protein